MSVSDLKELSQKQLSGKWKTTVTVIFIYLLIYLVISKIFEILPAYVFFLQSIILVFFSIGIITFLFNIIRKNRKEKISDLFSQTSIYPKAIILYLAQNSGFILTYNMFYLLEPHINNDKLIIIYSILFFILFIISLIISIIFAFSTIILVNNPSTSAIDALKQSKKLMVGNKLKYMYIFVTFIGWFLFAILTFGVGLLFVLPYLQLTVINFYKDLKENKVQQS